MLLDIKKFIPKYTLARFNNDKKIWLKKERLRIEEEKEGYIVFYQVKRNTGKMSYGIELPKLINVNEKFKLAIVAYMCEGTNLKKGQFTELSGNKGRSIQFINSDYWLIKLVIDEFEKIGINRKRWRVYLWLVEHQHDWKKERKWWSRKLKIDEKSFKLSGFFEGDIRRKSYAPHGRASIELSSAIHAAIIDNLINLIRKNKL